jgi:quinol monooxygenase YgiN
MKAIKVQYTVQDSFIETNKQNIAQVMSALKSANISGVQYAAFTLEDGKTFVHVAVFQDEAGLQALNSLEAFKSFQAALKASEPER